MKGNTGWKYQFWPKQAAMTVSQPTATSTG